MSPRLSDLRNVDNNNEYDPPQPIPGTDSNALYQQDVGNDVEVGKPPNQAQLSGNETLAVFMLHSEDFVQATEDRLEHNHFGAGQRGLWLVWEAVRGYYRAHKKLPNHAQLERYLVQAAEGHGRLCVETVLPDARAIAAIAREYDHAEVANLDYELAIKQYVDPMLANYTRDWIQLYVESEDYRSYSPEELAASLDHLLGIAKSNLPVSNSVFKMVPASEITSEPIDWLWPDRFARGMIHFLVGEAGVSKSFLTCDIAARVSTGRGWPDLTDHKTAPGDVVIVSAEDSSKKTIKPRLEAAGAEMDRVQIVETDISDEVLDIKRHIRTIEHSLNKLNNPALLIFDPITSFYGDDVNSHHNADIRRAMRPLVDLADKKQIAVICISHLNKNNAQNAKGRVSGSHGQVALARMVWQVTEDKDDEERLILTRTKGNITLNPGGLAYRLSKTLHGSQNLPRIDWEDGVVEITADEALYGSSEKVSAVEAAEDFLCDYLGRKGQEGALPQEIIDYGRQLKPKISSASIKRAKTRLNIKSKKQGTHWVWMLPDELHAEYQVEQDAKRANIYEITKRQEATRNAELSDEQIERLEHQKKRMQEALNKRKRTA